jgi:hypothetical protein
MSLRLFDSSTVVINTEAVDDSIVIRDTNKIATERISLVQNTPDDIDMRGPWRAVLHLNFWWAVGNCFMVPSRNEEHAKKICAREENPTEAIFSY